jgi:tRNA(fMet)-specific endonuclease VapC
MTAPRFLLDTNILSYAIKQPKGSVHQRLLAFSGDEVCTSIVVACELRYGAALRNSAPLSAKVEALLDNILVLSLDEGCDRHYGEIRAGLEKAGTPIGHNDLLIAAQTRALGLTLVTHNVREFERVSGLAIEDWLEPVP